MRGSWHGHNGPPAYDPKTATTRRRQKQRRGFTRERDAKRALRDALTSVEQSTHVDYSTDSLGAYLSSWLDGFAVRETTAAQYRQQVELRILPYPLAAKRLQDARVEDLDELYRMLEREGGRGGKPLAPKSVRHTHGVLRKRWAMPASAAMWCETSRRMRPRRRPSDRNSRRGAPISCGRSWLRSPMTGCTRSGCSTPRPGCAEARPWGCAGRTWTSTPGRSRSAATARSCPGAW